MDVTHSASVRDMRNPAKPALAAWNRFWFEPTSTSTLGVIRIAFGLVSLAWALTLVEDLGPFFSSSGVVPKQPAEAWTWGLLAHSTSMPLVWLVFGLLVIGSVGVVLGFWSRLSMLLVFIGLMSFQRRDPWILNTGDGLMRLLSFYLLLAPTGSALSVDRFLRHPKDFWQSPLRSPWVVRLIQIQLSAVYLFAVWDKVQGTTWNNGTAVSYALRIGDLTRFQVPHAIAASALIGSLLTYGSLATELSMAFLVWNRKARPYVIAAGVTLHLFIDATLTVGFFSYQIFVAYLAWAPPDRLDALIAKVRPRLAAPLFWREESAPVVAMASQGMPEMVVSGLEQERLTSP